MHTRFLRRVLGWFPFGVLVVIAGVHWATFLNAGPRCIKAFISLMTLVPLVAIVVWLATFIRTIVARRKLTRFLATHVLAAVCVWPLAWNVGLFTMTFPYKIDKVKPTATIRVPTNETMRVAWGGDDVEHNYHAFLPDQRWAYDLTIEPAFHGSKQLEDYGCYGKTIVAPATARVHVAHDGEEDHVPGAVSFDFKKPMGNHVFLALDNGAFLLVAHMKKGSVLAREGAVVMEGEPIGQCGNSGNTSEPHIHVHAQRLDPKTRGFAEGLPLFFHKHDGAPMPLGGFDFRRRLKGATIRHVASEPRASTM